MVGWAPYMRTPHPDAIRRRISAHLSYDMDGEVEQHVDFDFAAHTQGIRRNQYEYAAKNWPLFRFENPNLYVVGHEYEDGGKPFTKYRPMPNEMIEAIIAAHKWLFQHIIRAEPVLYSTEISHDQLTTARHQDPGDWVMNTIMDGLGQANKPVIKPPDFNPELFVPERKPNIAPSIRTRAALRKKILSGKRKCTFNDAVYLRWITGQEGKQWSRRVWYTLRKRNYSPLAVWKDGHSLYQAICGTLMAESGGNPKAVNVNNNGPLPGGANGLSTDRGLAQINDAWWPNVSNEEAFDPAYAINFMVTHFPKTPQRWHGYEVWKRRA